MLTVADFIEAIERELRFRGVPFSRFDLLEWADSVWRLVEDRPDIAEWADRFLASAPARLYAGR